MNVRIWQLKYQEEKRKKIKRDTAATCFRYMPFQNGLWMVLLLPYDPKPIQLISITYSWVDPPDFYPTFWSCYAYLLQWNTHTTTVKHRGEASHRSIANEVAKHCSYLLCLTSSLHFVFFSLFISWCIRIMGKVTQTGALKEWVKWIELVH